MESVLNNRDKKSYDQLLSVQATMDTIRKDYDW